MPSLSSRLVTALLISTQYRHRLDSPSKVERYVREHSVRPAPFAPPRRLDHKVAFSVDTRHSWTCYRVVPRNAMAAAVGRLTGTPGVGPYRASGGGDLRSCSGTWRRPWMRWPHGWVNTTCRRAAAHWSPSCAAGSKSSKK